MNKITRYESLDGKIFEREQDCLDHEEENIHKPARAEYKRLHIFPEDQLLAVRKALVEFRTLHKNCKFGWSDGDDHNKTNFLMGWQAAIKFMENKNKANG